MENTNRLVVELLSNSLAHKRDGFLADFRIVMSWWKSEHGEHGRVDIDWRHDDRLGHDSWRQIELDDWDEDTCRLLAMVIVEASGAWPDTFPSKRPEYKRPARLEHYGENDASIKLCLVECWSAQRSLIDEKSAVLRIAHREQRDRYEKAGLLRHYSTIEVKCEDQLGEAIWETRPFWSPTDRFDDPRSQLLENAVTLLDLRFGAPDHRREMYRVNVVAPTKYVPCKCARANADADYEVVVACRHCGNVIGPAQ
ncbi:MAG: hypothetical protein ACYSWU_18405 [Planctomycetota bacterium]